MREFDCAINKLSKILFLFFSEEKIESMEEMGGLLEMVKQKIFQEQLMKIGEENAIRSVQNHYGNKKTN